MTSDEEKHLRFQMKRIQKETMFLSSIITSENHPLYKELVEAGPSIIPVLLEDMREHPSLLWISALEELTGVNPVLEKDRGRVVKTSDRWVDWGIERNLL